MKVLLIYMSKHGCTERAANILKEKIAGLTLCNLKHENVPSLQGFDAVIIGGSIHAGRMQGALVKFGQQHQQELLTKRLGLFLCCMDEGEKGWLQFNNAFSEELCAAAKVKSLFGGAFFIEKMNFLERFIVKKVAGVTEGVCKLNEQEIRNFAEGFKRD